MRVRYSKSKGKRIKKGTKKFKYSSKRINIFSRLTMLYNPENDGEHLYWAESVNKWCTWDEWDDNYDGFYGSSKYGVRSVRSAISHLKKHSSYLPKGCIFELESMFVGCGVYITI